MINQIISASFQIIITCILSLFFIENNNLQKIENFFLIITFFVANSIILILPLEFEFFNFTHTYWNFSGKIYSILFSIIFIYIFKQRFQKYNYIKLKQEKHSFKKIAPLLLFLTFLAVLDGLQTEYKIWENEKLIFQIFMPSLEEEIAYRGILIGLFSNILLKNKVFFTFKINPTILITALLFGLMHALKVELSLNFYFNSYIFTKTFIYGLLWGWVTVKTKSIVLPVLFHSVSNVLPFLITFLK